MLKFETKNTENPAPRAAKWRASLFAVTTLSATLLSAGCGAPAGGDEHVGEAAAAISDWRDIAAPSNAEGGIAVASWAPGRRDYFYIERDTHVLVHGWSGDRGVHTYFESFPGVTLSGTPAAVSSADHSIDVVALGADHHLYHLPYTASGGWSYWRAVASADAYGSPALASWGPGRLDLFYRSSGNELLHRWNDGFGWSGGAAENLKGTCTTDPSATSWGYGRLDVVVGNSTGGVSHIAYDGGWAAWDSAGEDESLWWKIFGPPAITSNGYGELDVFYVIENLGIWGRPLTVAHTRFSGGAWSFPESSVVGPAYPAVRTVAATANLGYPEVNIVTNGYGWKVFGEATY